jgi:hypothetical protein
MEIDFNYNQVLLNVDMAFEAGPTGVKCVLECVFRKDPVFQNPRVIVRVSAHQNIGTAFALLTELTEKLDAAMENDTLMFQGDDIVPGPRVRGEVVL